MSLETSQKILKVFGIIDIVIGILGILVGILAVVGAGMIGASGVGDVAVQNATVDASAAGALALVAGIVLIVSAIITLLQGIFSVRAAKDSSKIMPAYVFAIIGLVSSVISVISSISSSGSSGLLSGIIGLLISCLVFVAANTIRKNA